MEKDGIGKAEMRSNQGQGECWIEYHQVGLGALGCISDAANQIRGGKKHSCWYPFDADPRIGLLGIEGSSFRMRRSREHGKGGRIEATPQLPQVDLDASHLWRKIVGDEQMGHDPPRPR
jgi:hypothetical protein